jgi:hypothetical protein
MTVRNMIAAAIAAGYYICVSCDGEIDYEGVSVNDALDAIEAVDEAVVYFDEEGASIGYALIVNDLDEDEKIADCSGWVNNWVDENM